MQLSTSIGFNGDVAALVSTAQNLEAAGIDVLWTAEINGFDAVSTLALLVGKTERVKLMTGIIPLYSRSPALIAQTAATLSEMSEGRFILGLGSSGPQVIEGWHGVPFGKPLQRTRATIDICQSIWSGEKVAYNGPGYQLPLTGDNTTGLGKALRFMGPPPTHPIPIALAAIGPRNVELTAAVADIWQTAHFVPERFESVWGDSLVKGTQQRYAGKPPLQIMAGGITAIGDGPHIEEARNAARNLIGFYVGGMGARDKNFYNDLFKRYGWEDEATKIQDLFLAGRREEAYSAVPDEYLDLATLIGDEDHVRGRIAAYRNVGVTHLDLLLHGPDHADTVAAIRDWTA